MSVHEINFNIRTNSNNPTLSNSSKATQTNINDDASVVRLANSIKESTQETMQHLSNELNTLVRKVVTSNQNPQGVVEDPKVEKIIKEVMTNALNTSAKIMTDAFAKSKNQSSKSGDLSPAIEKKLQKSGEDAAQKLTKELGKIGVTIDEAALGNTLSNAFKNLIPKSFDDSVRELYSAAQTAKTVFRDMQKIFAAIVSMKNNGASGVVSGASDAVNGMKQLYTNFEKLSSEANKLRESLKELDQERKDAKDNIRSAISNVHTRASSMLSDAKSASKDSPKEFTKDIVSHLSNILNNSESLKGTELARVVSGLEGKIDNISTLTDTLKEIPEALKSIKNIDLSDMNKVVSALDALSKRIGNLPSNMTEGDTPSKQYKELLSLVSDIDKLKQTIELKVNDEELKKITSSKIEVPVVLKADSRHLEATFHNATSKFKIEAEKKGINFDKVEPIFAEVEVHVNRGEIDLAIKLLREASRKLGVDLSIPVSALRTARDLTPDVSKAKIPSVQSLKPLKPLSTNEQSVRNKLDRYKDIVNGANMDDRSMYSRGTLLPHKGGTVTPAPVYRPMDVLSHKLKVDAEGNIKKLSASLYELQKRLIEDLDSQFASTPGSGWSTVKSSKTPQDPSKAFSLMPGGRQWVANIANERVIREKTKDEHSPLETLVEKYRSMLAENYTKDLNSDKITMLLGQWLKAMSVERIKSVSGIDDSTKTRLIRVKENDKGLVVGSAMQRAIKEAIGDDNRVKSVFKKTYASDAAEKVMRTGKKPDGSPAEGGKVLSSIALPAASINKTGEVSFDTVHGAQRIIPKFVKFRTGFEMLYKELEDSNNTNKAVAFGSRIKKVGIRPNGVDREDAEVLSNDMLATVGGVKGNKYISKLYASAAKSKGIEMEVATEGKVSASDYEKKIASLIGDFNKLPESEESFRKFSDMAKAMNLTAYDVVRSLNRIDSLNVYDMMYDVLSGADKKSPIKQISKDPTYDKPVREFEKAVREIEGTLPLSESNRPRRGYHQENVVNLMARTSSFYGGDGGYLGNEDRLSPDDQKTFIKDLNLELSDTLKRMEAIKGPEAMPGGIKRLSSIGIPESQSGAVEEYRPGQSSGFEYLSSLNATGIKMYSEDLSDLAPFKQFQQAGRNISNVTNAMTNLNKGAETPRLRSEKEKALIESGRYGNKGYGYNVTAELRNTAANFEDQIVISGKLAEAMTTAVSGLVKPGPSGRIFDKVTNSSLARKSSVTNIEKDQKLVSRKEVEGVTREYMKILGMPEEYEGRADEALIEAVEKTVAMVRGSSVEVQRAKLAETFMNHFGRKLTTRYGSKGVSISPTSQLSELGEMVSKYGGKGVKVDPKATLGYQIAPKSMGELSADLLGDNISSDFRQKLIASGNKFLIDMFHNPNIVIAEEAGETAKLYRDFSEKWKEVFKEGVPSIGPAGISNIREAHKSKFGEKAGYDLKPIEVRISSYGAAKRGLQTEFMESIFSNIAGTGVGGATTLKQFDNKEYDRLLRGGVLADYASAIGYQGVRDKGKTESDLAPEMFKMFGGKGDINEALTGDDEKNKEKAIIAKKAAALEAQSTFYSNIIDEFGNERTGMVGEKFMQIIEEPTLHKEWERGQIESGAKGARLNVPAFSAYSSVFGDDSAFMKEVQSSTSMDSNKHFEYIKAIQSLQDKSTPIYENLTKNLRKIDVKDIRDFEASTGTYDPREEIDESTGSIEVNDRSFEGTVFDPNLSTAFNLVIPTGRRDQAGNILKEEVYIPGPTARSPYPDPLLAGEYGLDKVSRSISNLINSAQKVDKYINNPKEAMDEEAVYKKVVPTIGRWTKEARDLANSNDPNAESKINEIMQKMGAVLSKERSPSSAIIASLPNSQDPNRQGQKVSEYEFARLQYSKQLAKKVPSRQAMATVIGDMSDMLIGKSDGKGAGESSVKKSFDSGNIIDLAKKLDIDTTQESKLDNAIKSLQRAKIDYYKNIADTIVGKTGSVDELFLTRKIPSVIGKAVNAVVDKREDLSIFRERLKRVKDKYNEDFSEEEGKVASVSNKHMSVLEGYKKIGVPILKQRELGVPENFASKLPVTYERKYNIDAKGNVVKQNTEEVNTTLDRLLSYSDKLSKANIDPSSNIKREDVDMYIKEDLAPYIESIRYPFTGTSSIAPFKPKVIKDTDFMDSSGRPLSSNSLIVPGVPEGVEGLAPVIESVQKRIDALSEKREELQTSDASASEEGKKEIERLTSVIRVLNSAISDVIPKYTAQAQKLDFDGDQIEIHAARTAAARGDIAKHFDRFHKSNPDADIRTQDIFMQRFLSEGADVKTTGPYVFGESQAAFEKKFPSGKGFEFMRSPFLDEKMDYMSPTQALEVLSKGKSSDNVIEDVLKEISRPSTEISSILGSIDSASKPENVMKLLEDFYNKDEYNKTDVIGQVKHGIKKKFYEEKVGDTTEAQLFKIHTGPETEGLYRLHRLAENSAGFGGGLIDGKKRTSSTYFKERFPDIKSFGGSPEEEFHTMVNEVLRFGIQKGMDVKHAGEKPVAGDMLGHLSRGPRGANELWEKIQNKDEKSYGDLRDFSKDSEKAIRMRLGELSNSEIVDEAKVLLSSRGMDTKNIDNSSRKELIDLIVEKAGFKGFLEEMAMLVRKEAIDGLVAQVEKWTPAKRNNPGKGKSPVGADIRSWAEKEVDSQMNSGGINISSDVTAAMTPLYNMRTFSASTSSEHRKYKEKFGNMDVPKDLVDSLSDGEYKSYSEKYKQSKATSVNLYNELSSFSGNPQTGAYFDMLRSSAKILHEQQAEIAEYATQMQNSGYYESAPGTLEERVINRGPSVAPFANRALNMGSSMRFEVERLSSLLGVPDLSTAEKNRIQIETTPYFAEKRRGELSSTEGLSEDAIEKDVQEYIKQGVEKAQALKQLDRVAEAVVARKDEGMFLEDLIPSKESPLSIEDYSRTQNNNFQRLKSQVNEERDRNRGVNFNKTMNSDPSSISGPTVGSGYTGDTGGFGGEGGTGFQGLSASGGIVPVHIVSADPSATINVRGLVGGGYLSSSSQGVDKEYMDQRIVANLTGAPKIREVIKKISPEFEQSDETTATYFSPSKLAGGGDVLNDKTNLSRINEQFEKLVENMTSSSEEMSPLGKALTDWGTLLHARVQKAIGSKQQNVAIEKYGEISDPEYGTIGGIADIVEYEDDTKSKVSKVIDIKSTSSDKIDELKKAKEKAGGSSNIDDVINNSDIKLSKTLSDYKSQLNAYLKIFDESATAELRFYDREGFGADPDAYESITIDFDPQRFESDMSQIARARKAVYANGGEFRRAGGKPITRPGISDLPSDDTLVSAMESAKSIYDSERSYKTGRVFSNTKNREDASQTPNSANPVDKARQEAIQNQYDKLKNGEYDRYLLPPKPAEGDSAKDIFTNLTILHDQAKIYQKMKGVDIEGKEQFPKQVGTLINEARDEGPDYQRFIELTNKLREEDPKKFSYKKSIDAWKAYRAAIGDWLISGVEAAEEEMSKMEAAGDHRGSGQAYSKFKAKIDALQEFVRRSVGKSTDIYTDDKRFVYPALAQRAGVYMNPAEIMKKIGEPLGEDDKLIGTFNKITGGLKDGNIPSSSAVAKDVFADLSEMRSDLVNVLSDAEAMKRVGPEVIDAWDFDKLTVRATRLREALQNVIKETGELDPEQKKHLQGVVNYLKSMENIRPDSSTGVTPVPKFVDPKVQSAMHARNVQSIKEYMRVPEENGGLPIDTPMSYSSKIVGDTGQVIKNTRDDFKKYGEEVLSSGEKVGTFSSAHIDLVDKMQKVNSTFGNAIKRVVMWGAASNLVYSGISYLGDSLKDISNIESELAQLRMVMNTVDTDFNKMTKSATGFAKQYGVPVVDILKSMKIFAQQGLTQEEIVDRTQTATVASNVTTLNAKDATEALTAAMVVFREEGDRSLRFLDAWSEVEAKHAIEAGHMANAIKKSAAAAKVAGFTFDQLNGIVAAIGSTTRQSGNEIGTSMRFISRRLFTEEGPKALAKLPKPIATIDGSGENKSGFSILTELAGQWKDLTEAQKLNIATSIGGTRQYNAMLVMMDQWDEVLRGVGNSVNSKGSSERRNIEIMKTYEKQLAQLSAAASELKMGLGNIILPTFKFGVQSLKALVETIINIPTPIKAAAAGMLMFMGTLIKGSPIIDGIADSISKGKVVFSGFKEDMAKQLEMAKYEITGKGSAEVSVKGEGDVFEQIKLKTIDKGDGLLHGSKLNDFRSSLGQIVFLLKEVGLGFNDAFGNGTIAIGAAGEASGEALKSVGNFLSISGGMVDRDKKASMTDIFDRLKGAAALKDLGPEGVKTAFKSGPKAVGKLGLKAAGFVTEIAGLSTTLIGEIIDSSSEYVGAGGHKILKNFASENTGLVKAIAPMALSMVALVPAVSSLYEGYLKLAGSAKDYAAFTDANVKSNETQLQSIQQLIQSYDALSGSFSDIKQTEKPEVKKRRMELGTYESPLIGMQRVQERATEISNSLADSNLGLVIGYDKLGNAVLKSSGNMRSFLKEAESLKKVQGIDIEKDRLSKYVTELTETGGVENFKVAMKDLAESFPVIGDMISKGININPIKALEIATEDVNKKLNMKQKYPLSSAADADIKKLQEVLKGARGSLKESYSDFKVLYKNIVSPSSLSGLDSKKIESLLTSPDMRKAYELQINIDPKFKLMKTPLEKEIKKSGLDPKDFEERIRNDRMTNLMGKEVLSAVHPGFAGMLDVDSKFTTANMETAGIKSRSDRRVHSGDILTLTDEANFPQIAGNQAIAKLKKDVDGTMQWVAEYFNNATMKIEERPFDDLSPFIENIFPLKKIQEDLSYRMEALNTFTAGASAGLVGISSKDFKKDFNLGERFFSDIPTTTMLQGDFGYTPNTGYGKVPEMASFGQDIKEFYFKPMTELNTMIESLEKLRLEGMESGDATIDQGKYEEIEKLMNILKNNQVVLQFRAVFVDLMKEFSEGNKILNQNLSVMRNRIKFEKETSGFTAGMSKGIEDYQTGINRLDDVTPRQSMLMKSKDNRQSAAQLKELSMRADSQLSQMDAAQKALVNVDDIKRVAKATGASLKPENLGDFIEKVAKESDTVGPFKELSAINVKVADNTSATVDRLDSLLENQGDPETLGKALNNISEKIASGSYDGDPSSIAKSLERVAELRNRAEKNGQQDVVMGSNRILDQLSQKMFETVGLKEGSKYISKRGSSIMDFFGNKDFSEAEFKQRAFSGVDSDDFLRRMKDSSPHEDSFFWKNKGFGDSELEKGIREAKAKEGEKPLVSADTMSKVAAATAAAAYVENLGNNKVIAQYDDRISQLNYKIDGERSKGKGEPAIRELAKEREALLSEKDKTQKSIDFYGTVQALGLTGVAANELGMSLGLTESQIKYLNVAAFGTYAAMKIASKSIGEELPESAKEFGRELKKVGAKVLESGEMPGASDLGDLRAAGEKLQKQTAEKTKNLFGKTPEELKTGATKAAAASSVSNSNKSKEHSPAQPQKVDNKKNEFREEFASQYGSPYDNMEKLKKFKESSPEAAAYADMLKRQNDEYMGYLEGGASEKGTKDIKNRHKAEKFEWRRNLNKDYASEIEKSYPLRAKSAAEELKEGKSSAYSKALKEEYGEDITKMGNKAARGAEVNGGTNRIQQAVAMYMSVALTDYVGKKNVERTEMADLEVKMKKQQDMVVTAMERYPDAAENVLKDLYSKRSGAVESGEPSDILTITKSLVQNTDTEYNKIVKAIEKNLTEIGKAYEETTKKMAKRQRELLDSELRETDRRASKKTATDELSRVMSGELSRKFSFKNAIQKGMSNYGGDFEVPSSKGEMSTQQRLYSKSGGDGSIPYQRSYDLSMKGIIPESASMEGLEQSSLVRFAKTSNLEGLKYATGKYVRDFTNDLKDRLDPFGNTGLFSGNKKLSPGNFANNVYKYSRPDIRPEMNAYSDGQNVLESMRKNVERLSTRRNEESDIVNNSSDELAVEDATKRYDELTKAIETQTDATKRYEGELARFAKSYSYLDKFVTSLYQLQNAVKDIDIQEAIDTFPGYQKFKDRTDMLLGGSNPSAVQSVTPQEEREAAKVGISLVDMKSNKFDKMEASLRSQARTATGQSAIDINQQLADLPVLRQREEFARDQQRFDEANKRAVAPYQEQFAALEKTKTLEGLSPDIKSSIVEYQAKLMDAINSSFDVIPIGEAKENLINSKGNIDESIYNTEMGRIDKFKDAGFDYVYRGITPEKEKELLHSVPEPIEAALTRATKESGEGLTMYKSVSEPIVAAIDETNNILKQVAAKQFGIDLDTKTIDPIKTKGSENPTSDSKIADVNSLRNFISLFNSGGSVTGPGSKTSDSIPAMLSNGEFVIKADAVQRLGIPKLNYMNSTGKLPGFAEGGVVDEDLFDWLNADAAKRYKIPSRKRNSDGSKVPGSGGSTMIAGARGAIDLPRELLRFAEGGPVSSYYKFGGQRFFNDDNNEPLDPFNAAIIKREREYLDERIAQDRRIDSYSSNNSQGYAISSISQPYSAESKNENTPKPKSIFDDNIQSGEARWKTYGRNGKETMHYLSELGKPQTDDSFTPGGSVSDSLLSPGDATWTTYRGGKKQKHNLSELGVPLGASHSYANRTNDSNGTLDSWAHSTLAEANSSMLEDARGRGRVKNYDNFMGIGAQYDTENYRKAQTQKEDFAEGASVRSKRWERAMSAGRGDLASGYFGSDKKQAKEAGVRYVFSDKERQLVRLDNDPIAHQSFTDLREKNIDRTYDPELNLASSATASGKKTPYARIGGGGLPFYLGSIQKNIDLSERALSSGSINDKEKLILSQSIDRSKALIESYKNGKDPMSENFLVGAVLATSGGTLIDKGKDTMTLRNKRVINEESPGNLSGLAMSILLRDKAGIGLNNSSVVGYTSAVPNSLNGVSKNGGFNMSEIMSDFLSGNTDGASLSEYLDSALTGSLRRGPSNKGYLSKDKYVLQDEINEMVKKALTPKMSRATVDGSNSRSNTVQEDLARISSMVTGRGLMNLPYTGPEEHLGPITAYYSEGGEVKSSQEEKLDKILNRSAEVMHNGGTVHGDGLVFAKSGETFMPKGFASGGLVEGSSVGTMSMNTSSAVKIDASDILSKLENIELKVEDKLLKVDSKSIEINMPKIVVEKPEWRVGVDMPKDNIKVSIDVNEAASRLNDAITSALSKSVKVDVSGTSGNSVGSDKFNQLSETVSKISDRIFVVKNELEGKIKLISSSNNETSNIDRKVSSIVDGKLMDINRDLNEVRSSVGNISSVQRQKDINYQAKFDDLDYRLKNAMNITGIGRGI